MILRTLGTLLIAASYISSSQAMEPMISKEDREKIALARAQSALRMTNSELDRLRTIQSGEIKSVIKQDTSSSLTDRYEAELLNGDSVNVHRYVWTTFHGSGSKPSFTDEFECERVIQMPHGERIYLPIRNECFSILETFYKNQKKANQQQLTQEKN